MLISKRWSGRIGLTLTAAALALNFSVAQAVPFHSGLNVGGYTLFDDGTADGFSFGNTSGSFTGGGTTSSTYAGSTVTGDNPVSSSVTETGDTVGFTGNASATDDEYAIGLDSNLNLTNDTASSIFDVTVRLSFSNSVNADGDAAFADSELTLFRDGVDEIFFSDLLSDTEFGDEIAGELTGTYGEALLESGELFFDFLLNPSETLDLDLSWTLAGGDFLGGLATADLYAYLSIEEVTVRTPLPGTLFLVGIGMILLPLQRRLRGYIQR